MKWLIFILLVVGPGVLIPQGKPDKVEIDYGNLGVPLLELKEPLDTLNHSLEELSLSLDQL